MKKKPLLDRIITAESLDELRKAMEDVERTHLFPMVGRFSYHEISTSLKKESNLYLIAAAIEARLKAGGATDG